MLTQVKCFWSRLITPRLLRHSLSNAHAVSQFSTSEVNGGTYASEWMYTNSCVATSNTWMAELFSKSEEQVHVNETIEKFCGLNWHLRCHKHWNVTSLTFVSMFTVFTRLLATLDCTPHEMVLKNGCKPPLIVSRSWTYGLPKPLKYIRVLACFAFIRNPGNDAYTATTAFCSL